MADIKVFIDIAYKYENLMEVIEDVYNQKGDDVCWMDIDRIFEAAGLPVPDRKVGDKEHMLKNCERFVNTMCNGEGWRSYAELEQEISLLEGIIEDLKETIRSLEGQQYVRPVGNQTAVNIKKAEEEIAAAKKIAGNQTVVNMLRAEQLVKEAVEKHGKK